MSEIEQAFTELFYGAGKWLGLILIISIVLVICWKKKEASLIFFPITVLMGLEYIENVSYSDPFFYGAVIMMVLPLFIVFDYLRGKI